MTVRRAAGLARRRGTPDVSPESRLRRLERQSRAFGPGMPEPKLVLLAALRSAHFARSRSLVRLHEALCFMQAWPDDARVRQQVDRMLATFSRRSDLRRHRRALVDSGIAGTPIHYPFFEPTAQWLAERWPERLRIDWPAVDETEVLDSWLPLLALYAESPALDELPLELRAWLRLLKGPRETDAAFLLRRMRAARLSGFWREKLWDQVGPPLILAPGPDTPSRTCAALPAPLVWQTTPLPTGRPELAAALRQAAPCRPVPRGHATRLIEAARGAMVTRGRDLDAFSWASPDDVQIVDWKDGLRLAWIGMIPERRLLLEALYGYVLLQNGVPVGYGTVSALFASTEIAFNIFESFRGAATGLLFTRLLAATRHRFGAQTFVLPPYQLGEDNDEAIQSGAWWFYARFGFAPRDPATARLARREVARRKQTAAYRTSRATLRRLASAPLFYSAGPARADVLGVFPLARVGLAVTRATARRFGADREAATRAFSHEAATRLGLAGAARRTTRGLPVAGWATDERLAWSRWAPIVALLPGLERWRPAARRALLEVVRAKGGRSESAYVARFDAHQALRQALAALAGKTPASSGEAL